MVRGMRGGRVVSAVAVFLTAVALQQASTVTWARATAESGARYRMSVVGVSRMGTPSDQPRTDCRWWPKYGSTELCAPTASAPAAQGALRRAYPCLQVAMWLAVLSILLQTLRVPRSRILQAAIPAGVSVLSIVAIYSMLVGARDGLAVLQPLDVHFTGAGFALALIAAALSALSALLLLASFEGARRDAAAEPPPAAEWRA